MVHVVASELEIKKRSPKVVVLFNKYSIKLVRKTAIYVYFFNISININFSISLRLYKRNEVEIRIIVIYIFMCLYFLTKKFWIVSDITKVTPISFSKISTGIFNFHGLFLPSGIGSIKNLFHVPFKSFWIAYVHMDLMLPLFSFSKFVFFRICNAFYAKKSIVWFNFDII